MTQQTHITLASDIDLVELTAGATFKHRQVIDLRCGKNGAAKPIHEQILKHLRYWFVEYEQLPMDFASNIESKLADLFSLLLPENGEALVLTDNISRMADIFTRHDFTFNTSELYVVENKSEIEPQLSINTERKVPFAVTANSI